MTERNLTKSRKLAELKALQAEFSLKLTKQERSDLVYDLNRNYGVSYREMSKILNVSVSGLSRMANPPMQDNTQETHRLIDHGFDFDVLIRHFQMYMPKDDEEREQIRKLSVVLATCARR